MAVGVSLFLGLIGYMVYFQVFKSDELLNRPENKRQDKVEAQVIRGSVLASDGTTVLAETQVEADGVEKRVYPFGSLFAHTVGYQVFGGSGLESTQNNTLIRSATFSRSCRTAFRKPPGLFVILTMPAFTR
jgi:peptidoglycan glycosyltransferase